MVIKTPLGGKNVQVTFRMPSLEGVAELHLSGDFNGWSTTAAPLARLADGSWTVTLVLEAGRSYRYRFCDGEGLWHNDWQADAYVPNDFGSEDSVVVVAAPAVEQAPAKRPAVSKKPPAKKAAASKKPPAKKATASKKSATTKAVAKKPAAKKPAARGRVKR